jgi:tungstate transport system substrate-binding protein
MTKPYFSNMRRLVVMTGLAGWLPGAGAQVPHPPAQALQWGVDTALAESGLAQVLQQAFGRETGVLVQIVPRPMAALLKAVGEGEFDALLGNAPQEEAVLEKQTLVHQRHALARGEFVIVGPATRPKEREPAGLVAKEGAVQALRRLHEVASATPGVLTFMSAGDGSGTHGVEQALWRAAGLAPAAPWYVQAAPSAGSLAQQARARKAYALVERGAWAARGGSPLVVRVQGDPVLQEAVHVMRPFRGKHPAGKLFMAWLSGPRGRLVAAGHRAYSAVR